MLSEKHDSVNRGRDEEQPQLHFPTPVQVFAESPADHAAKDQARGPARMKDVEVMCPVVREKSRDERIRHRLEGPVGHRKDERAPIEEVISNILGLAFVRAERDEGGEDMKEEGRND